MSDEQQPLTDWFGNPIKMPDQSKPSTKKNPMISVYGPGPEHQICKNCAFLAGIGAASTYYKCRLRTNTHGAKTDHRVRWPACSKFEQRTTAIPVYDNR